MATLSQSAWQYPYSTYTELYLENRNAGHRKFYEMAHTGPGWRARWGKIGTKGQTMYYESDVWSEKLSEKLKKGYVLERALSMSAASVPQGTPVPVVKPQTSDATLTDPDVLAKLTRIILFLNDKGKHHETSCVQAEKIKMSYILTGKLTKYEMEQLNEYWKKAGGGRW